MRPSEKQDRACGVGAFLRRPLMFLSVCFFFQAEVGIRVGHVTGVQTCALPICLVDLEDLKSVVGDDTAALMLTNPNTLGLFETEIVKMAKIVHDAGGKLYYDGANLNAIMGYVRPGDMGFDAVHLNLHKTFTGPHGGGGPGSGPIGVTEELAKFLPKPVITKENEKYILDYDRPSSIGRVKPYYGNFGINLRAYTYIRSMGPEGLKLVSEYAVLNAKIGRAHV